MSNSKKNEKNDVKLTKDDYDTFSVGELDISPELREEIESQGLVLRWINGTIYRKSGNFHKNRWVPYIRKDVKSDDFMATTPEGYIVRGDLILAVRPLEMHKRQRAEIAAKTARYKGYNKQKARELKAMADEAGVQAKIHEGYEDNE